MQVAQLWAIATAACREAKNGKTFVAEAEGLCATKIDVLSGKREAELSALGVVSGFHRPDGIVGDAFEREGFSRPYFDTFAGPGYAFGINTIVYAMTH